MYRISLRIAVLRTVWYHVDNVILLLTCQLSRILYYYIKHVKHVIILYRIYFNVSNYTVYIYNVYVFFFTITRKLVATFK